MHPEAVFIAGFLLLTLENVISTTLQEEEQFIKDLKDKTPHLPDVNKYFKIATEKFDILNGSATMKYTGIQSPIFVQLVEKYKDPRTSVATLHLIFLFRNSEINENELLQYFFMSISYELGSGNSQYHRTGICHEDINQAYLDGIHYCRSTYKFKFKEIWRWRRYEKAAIDETFIREWEVNSQDGWKMCVYHSSTGWRFEATLSVGGQPPQVKFSSKWFSFQALLESAVEAYLINYEIKFKLQGWKLLQDLEEKQVQELKVLFGNIPTPTLIAQNVEDINLYHLHKVCYHGDGTEAFAVFKAETSTEEPKNCILVAVRRGNCFCKGRFVPTHVTNVVEENIESEIEKYLSIYFPFLSEVLEDTLKHKLEEIGKEILGSRASKKEIIFQIVSVVDLRRSEKYAIYAEYAREDESEIPEGFKFVAIQQEIYGSQYRVEFVQVGLSESENDACEEIKKYSKKRIPVLPFRTWETDEEIKDFAILEASFYKIEQQIRESFGKKILQDLCLVNAAEVDYNGICGIIGIYRFTDSPRHDYPTKKPSINSTLLLPKPSRTNLDTTQRCTRYFAVEVEIDEFSQKWIFRDTLPICDDLEQVEYTVYFTLNGNFPFSPHWRKLELLAEDENVKNIELDVNEILHWNKILRNLNPTIAKCESKALFYKNYIIIMHLYGEKGPRSGYFSISSRRQNCAELVYLSPVLNETTLCYNMFQYIKQPLHYLENWLPVDNTGLENSHLPMFKLRPPLNNPVSFETQSSILKAESGKGVGGIFLVDNILERLKNSRLNVVRTISHIHGIQRMAILESINENKIAENFFIAWNESHDGFEIFHWSNVLENNIEKFLSNYIRYSWKASDLQFEIYQSLTTTAEGLIQWIYGNVVRRMTRVLTLSEDEIYIIYQYEEHKNTVFFGVLARHPNLKGRETTSSSKKSIFKDKSKLNNKLKSVTFTQDKGNIEIYNTIWTITFFPSKLKSNDDETIGLALMSYYKNPENGYFCDWIDYNDINIKSVSEIVKNLKPILRKYFSEPSTVTGEFNEPYTLIPLQIKIQPQIDRLILLYALAKSPAHAQCKMFYFYVAIVTNKCNYDAVSVDDYRINYVSWPVEDLEAVKAKSKKYIGYDLAFNLVWTNSHRSDGEPFSGKTASSSNIYLYETRTFVGEKPSIYYIYQDLDANNLDNFVCSVVEHTEEEVFTHVSQVCSKLVLEGEILLHKQGRRKWNCRDS